VEADFSNAKIEQNIENNDGIVIGIAYKTIIDMPINVFEDEVKEAIKKVTLLHDVEQSHKDATVELLQEALIATKEKSDAKITSCKEKFKYFIKGAGKVADKILAPLSSLATIATFFGL